MHVQTSDGSILATLFDAMFLHLCRVVKFMCGVADIILFAILKIFLFGLLEIDVKKL